MKVQVHRIPVEGLDVNFSKAPDWIEESLRADDSLKRSIVSPLRVTAHLEKLREKKRSDPLRTKSLFRTHPYFSERAVAIKKELGEPLSIADYVNLSNEY